MAPKKVILVVWLVFFLAMAAAAFAAVDLSITGQSVNPSTIYEDSPIKVSVDVKNIGNTTTDTGFLTYVMYYDLEGDYVKVNDGNLSNLVVGKGNTRTYEFNWTPTLVGTYRINLMLADPQDANATNDGLNFTITSQESTISTDLKINSIEIPILEKGKTAKINVTVSNAGTTACCDVTTFFRVKEGCATPTLVTYTKTFCILDGESRKLTFDSWSPSDAGGFCLDFSINGSNVEDTSPGNNQECYPVIVEDPLPGDVDISIFGYELEDEIVKSEKTEIEVLVSNNGGKATSSASIDLEVSTDDSSYTLHGSNFYIGPYDTRIEKIEWTPRETGAHAIVIKGDAPGDTDSDNDRKTLVVDVKRERSEPSTPSSVTEDYDVELSVSPTSLSVKAGDSNTYLVTIKNTGTQNDEYDLDLFADSGVSGWFTLDKRSVEISAGGKKIISLDVSVPWDEVTQTYPVRLKAESGDTVTISRFDLKTIERTNLLDVEISDPVVSPKEISQAYLGSIDISSSVYFKNHDSNAGSYLELKLYVNNEKVDTKNMYFSSGQTRTVEFSLAPQMYPISSKAGSYEVHLQGKADKETDKSLSTTFKVLESEDVKLTLSPTKFATTTNGTVSMSLRLENTGFVDTTYTLAVDSPVIIDLEPSEVELEFGESKIVTVTGTLLNAPSGNYTAKLYVESDDVSEYIPIEITVKSTADATAGTGGLTGFVLFESTTGKAALLIGLLFVVAIAGYYLSSKKETILGPLKKGGAEEGEVSEDVPPEPPSAEEIIPPEEEHSLEAEISKDEAAEVLENLDEIRSSFEKDISEVKGIKTELAGGEKKPAEEKEAPEETKSEPTTEEETPSSVNDYIEAVTKSV